MSTGKRSATAAAASITRPEVIATKTQAERAAINIANLRKGAEKRVHRRGGLTPKQRQHIKEQLKSKKPTIWRMPFKRLVRSALKYASNASIAEKANGYATLIEPYAVERITGTALTRLHAFMQGELLRVGNMTRSYLEGTKRTQLTPNIYDYIVKLARIPQHALSFDGDADADDTPKTPTPSVETVDAPIQEQEQAPKKKKKKAAAAASETATATAPTKQKKQKTATA